MSGPHTPACRRCRRPVDPQHAVDALCDDCVRLDAIDQARAYRLANGAELDDGEKDL